MRQRAKRLAIAIIVTVADIVAFNIYFGVIWLAWGWNPRVKAALVALLRVWIASETGLWMHVSNDLRRTPRERASGLTSNP